MPHSPGHDYHRLVPGWRPSRELPRVLGAMDAAIDPLIPRAARRHRFWDAITGARTAAADAHADAVLAEYGHTRKSAPPWLLERADAKRLRRTHPRSERRAMHGQLLRYLISRMHLTHGECGWPAAACEDGIYRETWAQIAAQLGETTRRVERAATELLDAGLIKTERRGRGRASKKWITGRLATILEQAARLLAAIDRRRKEARDRSLANRAERASVSSQWHARARAGKRAQADAERKQRRAEAQRQPEPPPAEDAEARIERAIERAGGRENVPDVAIRGIYRSHGLD